MGCVAVAVGLCPLRMFSRPHASVHRGDAMDTALLIMASGIFLIGGFLVFRSASRAIVVLTQDEVESTGLWRRQTIRLSEIRGKRWDGRRMNIFSRDEKQRKLVIYCGLGFVFDDFYRTWLATIPDLDAIDRDQQRIARESDLIVRRKADKLRFYEKWMGLEDLPYDGSYIPTSTSLPDQKHDEPPSNS